MDRRTFLGNGARASVAAAAGRGAQWHTHAPCRRWTRWLRAPRHVPALSHPTDRQRTARAGGHRPRRLLLCLADQGRRPWGRQSSYRIQVGRTDPGHPAQRLGFRDSCTHRARRSSSMTGPRWSGNAAYEWNVQVVGRCGDSPDRSRPRPVSSPLPEHDWVAQWLHPAAASRAAQPGHLLCGKWFEPPSGHLVRATAHVAAAHTFQLWINGQRADFGPSFCFPTSSTPRAPTSPDSSGPAQPTRIGVLHHWYGAGKGRPASAPGLLAQLTLVYADGRTVTYGTDGTWKERPAEWLPSALRNTDAGDFIEHIDGRAHPNGWATARLR